VAVLVAVRFVFSNYSMQRNVSVTIDTSIANEDVKQAMATRFNIMRYGLKPIRNQQVVSSSLTVSCMLQPFADHPDISKPRSLRQADILGESLCVAGMESFPAALGLKLVKTRTLRAAAGVQPGSATPDPQQGEDHMALMKTSNPALSDKTFRDLSGGQYGGLGGLVDAANRMTLSGTVNKTGVLLICALATAGWTWHLFMQSRDMTDVMPLMLVGMFGGLIFGLVTSFKKEWSPVTAPIYALLEGLLLGGLSAVMDLRYPGIGIQAVSLTFGTLFVLLLAYRSGLIKVTQKFRLGVIAATGGIFVFYLMQMLLGFFGIRFVSINGSGIIGIGFSLVVVAVAALNLVLDFDFIEQGVQAGAPKYMEWYGAFGIMVTLVWLYIEILRLLSKMRSRN
jgi:uncharacterized YccA/Bax inhibitor family protein